MRQQRGDDASGRGRSGRWVRVAPSGAVRGTGFLPVEAAGRPLLLARLEDGRVVAFERTCPHQDQPLTQGEVQGNCLVCPHHRYGYDARTGANVFPGPDEALSLALYPARERQGWVWVRAPGGQSPRSS